MIEKQIYYKTKKHKDCVCVGMYDRSFKDYVFKFTEEEMISLFKDLGIKFKFKVVK